MQRLSERQIIALILTTIIGAVVVGLGLFALSVLHVVPPDYLLYTYAGVWIVGTILVTQLISSLIKRRAIRLIGASNANNVAFIAQLLGYVVAFIGFFILIKVSVTAALAAGGFAGLVLGLASQTVLSNIFAGIMLVFSRPYHVGDRITISTWQYGLIAPTYPPKFFSNDFLIPGYTGRVIDITLLYTVIYTDEKVVLKIPNNIMVQAAIFIHNVEEKRQVRTKYEVPKDLDPEVVVPRLMENIKKKIDLLLDEPSIKVLETTLNTYILGIDVVAKSIYEEPVRDAVLRETMRTVRELQEEFRSKDVRENNKEIAK
ncbi:MAG: mechanosensitive ion channel family protein [Candidatus Aramenus sp.]|jgi:small-conductance mechanosensitive channel|nr:mechanosensitive ion channel family protein [Candidatus Aramenus sp.]